jgi:hypothetical protein
MGKWGRQMKIFRLKKSSEFYQWHLLIREAKNIGLTIKEIRYWFQDQVVSK